jgi:3-oxo-5-alpha-steroid 4-dehydrogenase 3
MLDTNLNLLLTFFWLILSAGILLPGIWLLIDCKINLSIINLILPRFYSYDKLTNHGWIPKSYFLHFYLIGLIINLIFFLFHLSFFLLFIIFILHLSRRLYECLYIHKYHSKITISHYFFGLIHYPCVGLTIIIDYKYSYSNINFSRYFFALFLFFNASYIQYNVHLTLAKLARCPNEIYPIPNGYWLFNYFSCPNYLAEILIYISFFIASHRTSAMAALIVWVFVNQSLSALFNHRWYCRYYKELYPSNRCALIPFIL